MFCSKSAFRELLRQTATDPDKILQVYVGRTQSHLLKFWRPGPNGRKVMLKRVGVFVTGTMNLHFCSGKDRPEIWGKR